MATRSLGVLTLDLIARTGKFNEGMNASERRVDQWSKRLKGVLSSVKGAIAGALAGLAVGETVRKVITATIEQENAVRQLEARLKSTGGVAGVTSRELQGFASELQRLTTYGDEAVLAMQGVLLTFTNIRGEVFKDATRAILDLSTAMGQDLQSSAVQVGKALNDPLKGITALQRIGVAFTESQKAVIKSLVDAGNAAAAQRIILRELNTEFGGAAEAAANTLGGSIQQLKNAFGDLFEAQDGVGTLTAAIRELTATIQDPSTVAAFQTLSAAILRGLANILETISAIVNVANWFIENRDKMFLVPEIEYVLREFQIIGTDLEKILDDIEFFEEQRDSILPWVLSLEDGVMNLDDINERLKELNLEANRLYQKQFGSMGPPRRLGPATVRAQPTPGDADAIKELEKLRDGLKQQIATFDQAAAAVMRYRIEQGDLAESFKKARAEGEPFRAQLIAFASEYEALQSGKAIADLTKDLRDQVAVLGLNAEETIRYRITQGDLVETFARVGAGARAMADELVAAARRNEEATNAQEIKDMLDDLRDQVALLGLSESAVIRYRIAHGDLARTFANAGEKSAEYAAKLVELTMQLQLMKEAQEGAAQAISEFSSEVSRSLDESLGAFLDDFEARFIETRDVMYEFMTGLAQGTENIIADALVSGFEGGAKGILKSFGQLMQRLIAEAVAADLAKRIFGSVSGGTGTGWLGMLAGAFGFGGPKQHGGPVMAGVPYLVGERGPEIIVPSRAATVIPNNRIGAQNNYITLTVETPTGRVPMETQQQLGNRLARALGEARRRNG